MHSNDYPIFIAGKATTTSSALLAALRRPRRPWTRALGVRIVTLGLLLAACACAAPLDNPERFTGGGGGGDAATGCASDVDVEADLLPSTCGSSVCHSDGASPAAGLDLVTPGMQERLGAAISGESCGSTPILVPGDPQASLLFQKLGPNVPCGSPMPLGQPALSANDVACISAWIEEMQ